MPTLATVHWVDGLQFEAISQEGYQFTIDGKRETGVGPMDLLLFGLAGCTAVDVVIILKKQRQPVQGVTVKVRGERATEHPKVFTKIHIEYLVTGDLDPKKVERAIQLSEEKFCSASAMLRKTAEITHSYQILPSTTNPV
ncbi:MAG TPA: OsmC family peroxiredoxin [Anaerolineae bacterium]|nr:OsmC family peroxiredoxin [Anaerolineae bacterium]